MSTNTQPVNIGQLAKSVGVSRRFLHAAFYVRDNGCAELQAAARDGLLPLKHCETIARSLPPDQQRRLLRELPWMTPRKRHDTLAALKANLSLWKGGGAQHG